VNFPASLLPRRRHPDNEQKESRRTGCVEKMARSQAERVAGVHVFSSQEGQKPSPACLGAASAAACSETTIKLLPANRISPPARVADGLSPKESCSEFGWQIAAGQAIAAPRSGVWTPPPLPKASEVAAEWNMNKLRPATDGLGAPLRGERRDIEFLCACASPGACPFGRRRTP